MPVPIIAAICWVCGSLATCYCAKKFHDAYKTGQKTKQMSIEQKSEIHKAKIVAATESNKEIDQKETEQKQKLEETNDKEKSLENEIEELKQTNKGNISEEDRKSNNLRLLALQDELDGIKTDKTGILNQLKNLTEQRSKNDQIINSPVNLSNSDGHWIWQFLTLENILIMLAIYALWQIVREDSRK